MRIATIDLGTNSVRLFVHELLRDGSVNELYYEKSMVRLGEGVFERGTLSSAASERTIRALHKFQLKIKKSKVDYLRAVATSALRVATDREDFLEQVFEETGIEIEVISGKKEAQLIAKGIVSNLILPEEPVLLVDIGGGSTEISMCYGNEVLASKSLRIGAARCQQVFLQSSPPVTGSSTGIKALRRRVRSKLDKKTSNFPYSKASLCIGSSGSTRAFGKLYKALGTDEELVPRDFITTITKKMSKLSAEELREIPELQEKRVDIILAAGIILEEIMRHFRNKDLQLTNFALKDGIIANTFEKYDILEVELEDSEAPNLGEQTVVS